MSIYQIIGLIILTIIILFVLAAYITLVKQWNKIKVGDKGTFIDDSDGWHTVISNIEVIKKSKDYIIIKYGNTQETIHKDEYVNQYKTFGWN